jgi:hypothetical protein
MVATLTVTPMSSNWNRPPAPQDVIDANTIAAQADRIRQLEYHVAQSDKRQQAVIDYIWREAVKLLQEEELSRKRLRQRLWVIMLKARAGHASYYG